MKNDYKIIDNELNRSFNSVKNSKLSATMKINSGKKRINSHNAAQLEQYILDIDNCKGKIQGNKELSTINIHKISEKKELLQEKTILKKILNENLEIENKYHEIETEFNIIRDIQNNEDNFQNEQRCKYLFLSYKIVESSLALFCFIGIRYSNKSYCFLVNLSPFKNLFNQRPYP